MVNYNYTKIFIVRRLLETKLETTVKTKSAEKSIKPNLVSMFLRFVLMHFSQVRVIVFIETTPPNKPPVLINFTD